MSINISVNLGVPAGASTNSISYARIDNLALGISPVFTNAGNFNTFPATIATNIPSGQYQVQAVPVYPDLRSCAPTIQTTPGCPGLVSITASLNNNVIVVNYVAPSTAPKVRITINYPNGGSSVANYVNDGNPISVGVPAGVFGTYSIFGQSVCDESSGFFSLPSSTVTLNNAQTISGSFLLGNSISAACGASVTTLYTNGSPVPGSVLFTDSTLSTVVTGFSFVIFAGIIYNLDPTTGTIGSDTGATCSSTMTARNSLSFINITSISGVPGFVYSPVSGTFNQGANHGAFTGMISVGWNGVVPGTPAFSIHLYRNGVAIDCFNYPTGSTSSTWTSGSFSYLATDVILIDSGTGSC
jgi:hypothetical protein